MPRISMLVTEVTKVGDERCVAGLDLAAGRMIRPEPAPGAFWAASWTEIEGPLALGSVVSLNIKSDLPRTNFPHRTEDRIVEGGPILMYRITKNQLAQTLRHTSSLSVQAAFQGKLKIDNERAFLNLNSQCPSLGSINIRRQEISILEDVVESSKRLRLRMSVDKHVIFPTITALDMQKIYALYGFDHVDSIVNSGVVFHIRLGVSRLFTGSKSRCHLQINGIYKIR